MLGKLIHVALVCHLVRSLLVVMLLQILDLFAASESLGLLGILNSLLVGKGLIKENLVTVTLKAVSSLAKSLLSGVVTNELKVALTVQKELLLGILLLLFFFKFPLVFQHGLLLLDKLLLLLSLDLASLLLPVKNGHSVFNLLLLLSSLSHFALEFLLSI